MKAIIHTLVAGLALANLAGAEVFYGASWSNGGSLWAINPQSNQASELAGQLGFEPANLATNTDRGILYVGQVTEWDGGVERSSLKIHAFDLATGERSLLVDLWGHPVVADLEDPIGLYPPGDENRATMQEGAAYHQGAFYLFLNSVDGDNLVCHGKPFGPGTTLYKLELTPNGKNAALGRAGQAKVSALPIGPMPVPGLRSVGDLGDFVIFPDGTVFGSSWNRKPPNPLPLPCQVGGFWTFHLSDHEHTFQLLEDTQTEGWSAPTYGLALGEDQETIYGGEYLTQNRVDVLATGGATGVLARASFPESEGVEPLENGPNQYSDLSSAMPRGRPLIPLENFELLESTQEHTRVRISWLANQGGLYEIQTSRELKFWGVPGHPRELIPASGSGAEPEMNTELLFPSDWERGFVRVRHYSPQIP